MKRFKSFLLVGGPLVAAMVVSMGTSCDGNNSVTTCSQGFGFGFGLLPGEDNRDCSVTINGNDADGDGVTDAVDICPVDPTQNCVENPDGDFDGDGLPNGSDPCPKDPNNACPGGPNGDDDGDGIINHDDPCPKDADNTCPAGDVDGDGIPNGSDLCPQDADNNCLGNPAGDFDGDGVPNGDDDCPTVAASPDVDGDGCPDSTAGVAFPALHLVYGPEEFDAAAQRSFRRINIVDGEGNDFVNDPAGFCIESGEIRETFSASAGQPGTNLTSYGIGCGSDLLLYRSQPVFGAYYQVFGDGLLKDNATGETAAFVFFPSQQVEIGL